MDPRETIWIKFDADTTAALEDLSKRIVAAQAEAEERPKAAKTAVKEADMALYMAKEGLRVAQ